MAAAFAKKLGYATTLHRLPSAEGLDVLAAEAPPPLYGFGVDADAGAAKLYVRSRDGAALPQLPATAEAAMPPVFKNDARDPPLVLSLEWRVGEATTEVTAPGLGNHHRYCGLVHLAQ